MDYYGKRTIVFIDEIHRFNKTQQDLLLPYIENGTFILIGATTENPYFELNRPLLSRIRVIKLKPLTKQSIVHILEKALYDKERGLGKNLYTADVEALEVMAAYASGDSRIALNLLEQTASVLPPRSRITLLEIQKVAGEQMSVYDKKGDNHYDITSAFIKSMRGSDPNAALHYLARMIEGEKNHLLYHDVL